jgi:hypothetical protein
VVEGDVTSPATLRPALEGVEAAYYLIHSMSSGRDFEAKDRAAARHFGGAARRAGVRRIIYLGGLGHGPDLSPHLRSRQEVGVGPAEAFAPICRIGGETGWYAYGWLWRLRGFIDLLVGGVGLRRGRPTPEDLSVGDALDFWRVEAYEPARRLLLAAEMKLPGRAWLEFVVEPRQGGATIRQTALFDPVGLVGLAYWYLVYPLHRMIFSRMLENIARAANAGRRHTGTEAA